LRRGRERTAVGRFDVRGRARHDLVRIEGSRQRAAVIEPDGPAQSGRLHDGTAGTAGGLACHSSRRRHLRERRGLHRW
jgi:hypothetical protein